MNSCLLSNKRRVNTFNQGASKWVNTVSHGVSKQAAAHESTHPPVERQERVSVGRGLALQDFENKVQALPPYSSYHQHRLQTAGNIFSNKFTPSSHLAN